MRQIKGIIRRLIKILFGIEGISLFAKKQKKNLQKLVYKKKYSAQDLVRAMRQMGMKNGSVIFLHSSMTQFYNYTGTAIELIESILDVIGEEGTLLMPAYPPRKQLLFKLARETNEIVFDARNTPSGAGYLSEVFRTFPGVKRSINLQHSVCAWGKKADYFVGEHHLSEVAWDSFSPYYKLGHTKGIIFSLGLDAYLRNVTLIHCTEAVFRHKYLYFASFFGKELEYRFLNNNSEVGVHKMILPVKGGVRSSRVIKKFFDKEKFKRKKLSNLDIEMVESTYMFNRCIELTEQGVCIYKRPSVLKYFKEGRFISIDSE